MPSRPRDWKSLENREELFFRYFTWRVEVHDLDHSHYCRYLTEGMTDDQKAWFCILFGMTYRTPQAYAYWWHFNDVTKIDINHLEEWHKENWQRTTYGTDARYNKGHFVKQTNSFLEVLEGARPYEFFRNLCTSNPKVNFYRVFWKIRSIYKFGRMTSWIACQALHDVLGLDLDFDNVLIYNPNNDSSMQSIWNGYCMLKGHYHRLLGNYRTDQTYSVTEKDLKEVSEDLKRYRVAACEYSGHKHIDVFKWESIWCQFKRLFNPKESKEYPGHSSGDATSRYKYYKENWPEVDWSKFRAALLTQPGIVCGQTYQNEYNKLFGRTGVLLNIHEMFGDMPNGYKTLGLDPNKTLVKELFEDQGLDSDEFLSYNKIERRI